MMRILPFSGRHDKSYRCSSCTESMQEGVDDLEAHVCSLPCDADSMQHPQHARDGLAHRSQRP